MKKKVLAATKYSSTVTEVIKAAKSLCDQGDELTILHIISDEGFSDPPIEESQYVKEAQEKTKAFKDWTHEFDCKVNVVVLRGEIVHSIRKYAKESTPDFMIMGHQVMGFFDSLINRDIRSEVLQDPPCPILCA